MGDSLRGSDPRWRDLPVATGAGARTGLVRLLDGELPADGLRLAGADCSLPWLATLTPSSCLAAARTPSTNARGAATVELASALRAVTGDTAIATHSSLPVDLDELADVLGGPVGEVDGRLDRLTGAV